jgi:phosphatidylserine/phosphatidylglycerophosphate/cardiolipin synthase-like enzyme
MIRRAEKNIKII